MLLMAAGGQAAAQQPQRGAPPPPRQVATLPTASVSQTASGTVRSVDGLPIAAARVRAYRVRYSLLGRRLKIVKTGLTNDLGEFRLSGLDPGDYYVSASYSERA